MSQNQQLLTSKNKLILFFSWLKQFIAGQKSFIDRYFLTATSPIYRYIRRTIDYVLQAILLLIMTIVFNTGLLFAFKMLWGLYRSTHVGQTFIRTFPEKAGALAGIAYYHPFFFSLELSLSTFYICFVIASVCQVFHIARYFYYPRNFFGKVLIWGALLTIVNAYFIYRRLEIEYFEMLCVLAAIPTLCVFMACFRFADGLLPELGEVIAFIKNCVKYIRQLNYKDIKKFVDNLILNIRR